MQSKSKFQQCISQNQRKQSENSFETRRDLEKQRQFQTKRPDGLHTTSNLKLYYKAIMIKKPYSTGKKNPK